MAVINWEFRNGFCVGFQIHQRLKVIFGNSVIESSILLAVNDIPEFCNIWGEKIRRDFNMIICNTFDYFFILIYFCLNISRMLDFQSFSLFFPFLTLRIQHGIFFSSKWMNCTQIRSFWKGIPIKLSILIKAIRIERRQQ